MYSWLRFITEKIYKAKSAKGKGTLGKSMEETRHKLPSVLPQGIHTECASFLQEQGKTTGKTANVSVTVDNRIVQRGRGVVSLLKQCYQRKATSKIMQKECKDLALQFMFRAKA